MTAARPTRRPGFTLLELLLALGLGVVLLGALYVALDTTLQQTQAGRDAADVEGVSRAVFNRVGVDLSNVLGPNPPKSGGGVPETAAATTATPSTTPTTPTPPTTPAATDTTAAEADPEATAEPTATASTPAANLPLQLGVYGDATRLSVFASRVPGAFVPGTPVVEGAAQQPADLVRIDYWLAAGGGLARKETPWVTADGVWNGEPLDRSTEAADVIAEEVTGLTFEYYDGTDWAESWTGGGGSVPAPPRAVRVTLTFGIPNPRGGDRIDRTVSQVVVVRTAPGDTVPELTDPVASSGTTPAESSAGSSSGASGSSGGTSSGTGSSGSSGSKPTSSGGTSAGAKSTSGTTGGSSGGTTNWTGSGSTGGTSGGSSGAKSSGGSTGGTSGGRGTSGGGKK